MPFQSTVPAADLKSDLASARARTDELFRMVRPGSLYERPVPERHRMVFYLGHLEAFDWNQLGAGALSMTAFHPEFDRLFAFGIDPPQGQLPRDGASDWPSLRMRRWPWASSSKSPVVVPSAWTRTTRRSSVVVAY